MQSQSNSYFGEEGLPPKLTAPDPKLNPEDLGATEVVQAESKEQKIILLKKTFYCSPEGQNP